MEQSNKQRKAERTFSYHFYLDEVYLKENERE